MKKMKFNDGGDIGNRMMQMIKDEKMRKAAGKAYDEAMPEADTSTGELSTASKTIPSKYSSVRPNDFEENVKNEKIDAVKQGLRGTGKIAKQAGLVALPGGAGALMGDAYEVNRGAKMVKGAVKKFQTASEKEGAADRELNSQLRREARGVEYKKGGSVGSASKRADGIATKGKTRGKMV
jgi:hypothetical protein